MRLTFSRWSRLMNEKKQTCVFWISNGLHRWDRWSVRLLRPRWRLQAFSCCHLGWPCSKTVRDWRTGRGHAWFSVGKAPSSGAWRSSQNVSCSQLTEHPQIMINYVDIMLEASFEKWWYRIERYYFGNLWSGKWKLAWNKFIGGVPVPLNNFVTAIAMV